jgi:hypothetical protein
MRKWVVADSSIAGRMAYLSKDVVMAAFLVLGAGRGGGLTNIAEPFLVGGLILLGIGAVFSSLIGIDPIGAALTIRTFFVLPVACWTAGRKLPADSIRRFALWIAILSVPLALLGALQFFSPSKGWINRYSSEGEQIVSTSSVTERVRATGTFSYITGFGEFAPAAVWAGIVTFTLGRTKRERWLGYAAVVAGMCCAFVTVSRAVAIISLGLVVVWAVVGGNVGRKIQVAVTIGTAAFALLFLTGRWDDASEIATTVYQRHASVSQSHGAGDTILHRLWYTFIVPLDAIAMAPFGNGLGSEQGGRMFKSGLAWTFEGAWGRMIMEVGLPGLFGFVLTLGVVFAPLKAAYWKNPQNERKTVLAVTFAALLARAVVGFQFGHVAAYFFWSMGATVLALSNGIQPPTMSTPGTGFGQRNSGRTLNTRL